MGSSKWGNMELGRESGRWNGREVQTKVKPFLGSLTGVNITYKFPFLIPAPRQKKVSFLWKFLSQAA